MKEVTDKSEVDRLVKETADKVEADMFTKETVDKVFLASPCPPTNFVTRFPFPSHYLYYSSPSH